MKKLRFMFMLGLLVTNTVFAHNGSEGGGGGDASERRVDEIRSDLLGWIQDGGAEGLELPYGITLNQYESQMSDYLQPKLVTVIFVERDDPKNRELQVYVDGKPKTCRGFFSTHSEKPFIICNIARFNRTEESEQYRLIHHEYAGLAYLERNEGSSSDYFISNQITNYLRPESVLRMAVLPTTYPTRGSNNYEASYINEDGSVSIFKPRFKNPTGNGNLWISRKSDFNGLCKLYGLGNFIPNSRLNFNQGKSGRVVRVNSGGRFNKFDLSKDVNAIQSFSCKPLGGLPGVISNNYQGIYDNEDGSVTIAKPMFKQNGNNLWISRKSDLNGLCKLYGLGNFIPNSRLNFNQGRSGRVVRVNSGGKFNNFDLSEDVNAIQSFMCERY